MNSFRTQACVISFALTALFPFHSTIVEAQDLGSEAESSTLAKVLIPHPDWSCGMAEGIPTPEEGELIFDATMKLAAIYDVGQTQYGKRKAYVIESGEVVGSNIRGIVEAGALDFELTLSNGVFEIEQILILRTDDGKSIYVRNAGVGPDENDVRIVCDFEAPNSSNYTWLHEERYIARRVVDANAKTMVLRVYNVTLPNVSAGDVNGETRIAKPENIPSQSWDYRRADETETQSDEIVSELVTLGPSASVGPTKKGIRNIIPITGGTVAGKIEGQVLFGGADYQNLSNPATIDARYLWQTGDGEIIIVRNAGRFGGLVPTFEARVDGKYDWLNEGKYLSSNPRMGPGGVRLTFYESK